MSAFICDMLAYFNAHAEKIAEYDICQTAKYLEKLHVSFVEKKEGGVNAYL